MKTKDDSVNLVDLHPKVAAILPIIDGWCREHLGYEAIITSGCDGVHSTYSRHYCGCAVDLRTWTRENSGRQISGAKRETLAFDLSRLLGEHFKVLDEGTHFHIGFKPSRPAVWGDLQRARP